MSSASSGLAVRVGKKDKGKQKAVEIDSEIHVQLEVIREERDRIRCRIAMLRQLLERLEEEEETIVMSL
jgi:hypothetical protein